MKRLTGMYYEWSDGCCMEIYDGETEVCMISDTIDDYVSTIAINGIGCEWISHFYDDQYMIKLRMTRVVYERKTGKEIFSIENIGDSTYAIIIDNKRIIVSRGEIFGYTFYYEGDFLAYIYTKEDKEGYEIKIKEGLGGKLTLAILSFPLLSSALLFRNTIE